MYACSVNGCNEKHKARGLCNKHYRRLRAHGTVDGKRIAPGVARNFFEHILLSDHGDKCLVWPYAKGSNGYGKLCIAGVRKEVHRLVCERCHGTQPSTKHEVAHSCGNRSCVNPNHLRWATSLENSQDMRTHCTIRMKEQHPNAKLTNSDVQKIRALKGRKTQKIIAAQFKVSRQAISVIHSGKRWV